MIQHTEQADPSRAVNAICAVFFLESVVLGNWIPRIPDIKNQLDMNGFELGVCLFGLSMGTMLALLTSAHISRRFGLNRTMMVALVGWSLSMALPGLAQYQYQLLLILFLAGIFVGLTEVTMNTLADAIEKRIGKRIMSRCHGFWSLGSLAGALGGAALAHVGLSIAWHFLLVMPLVAVIAIYCVRRLPAINDGKAEMAAGTDNTNDSGPSSLFPGLPNKGLLLLCLTPVGIMCVEGSFIDWSALFVRTELMAGAMATGFIYAFFSITMATMRLMGDRINDRFAASLVARVSATAATIGTLLFAFSPNLLWAFIGAGIAGAGVANIYPLAMTAAAERDGDAAANVSSVALIAFSAFLLSPPITGWLADLIGLRMALAIYAPLAATTLWLARELDGPGGLKDTT